MKFFGNGSVWDSKNNKELIRFEDGIVETNDVHICSVLKEQGFKFEGKMKADLDEKTIEIKELKEKVIALEKTADPETVKQLEALKEKISDSEGKIKDLEDELAENQRSADIIREKVVELKLADKKQVKDMPLLNLCEIFISKLQGEEEDKDNG